MRSESPDTVEFVFRGRTTRLPVLRAAIGQDAVDLTGFSRDVGIVALDRGFFSTASTTSAITYIDGEAGVLRYRGYAIEELAVELTFLEVAWLLIHGDLPKPSELTTFSAEIAGRMPLPEDFMRFFAALPRTARPMSVLSAAVSVLSTYHEDALDPRNRDAVDAATLQLLAQLPVIAAYVQRNAAGRQFLEPDSSLTFVENLLSLSFANPTELYRVDPVRASALDQLLILHADHEQNASTSAVRLVGSTGADLFASVAAGINALQGPLHGGANEAVLAMLGRIRDSGEGVARFVERVKAKQDGAKLMGFGHRVYKSLDPRARIVKRSADAVLADLGLSDPLLDIAKELEELALGDEYFIERRLYPNVDFYTGVIYKAMGFPVNMMTALFAVGRLPGWIAHWREANADPATKLSRPQQLYVGPAPRRVLSKATTGTLVASHR